MKASDVQGKIGQRVACKPKRHAPAKSAYVLNVSSSIGWTVRRGIGIRGGDDRHPVLILLACNYEEAEPPAAAEVAELVAAAANVGDKLPPVTIQGWCLWTARSQHLLTKG